MIRVRASAVRISLCVGLSWRRIVGTSRARVTGPDRRSWRQLLLAFRDFSIEEGQQYSAPEQESNHDSPGQRKME
jgi:hypothetical protein